MLRHERKLTQEGLADLSELHVSYIAQIERGERNPTLRSILSIAVGLQVSIGALLEGVDAAEG